MAIEMANRGWYSLIDDDTVEQGDFINRFPILIPPYSEDEMLGYEVGQTLQKPISIDLYKVVVMTQSCDLRDYTDEDNVILCPRYDYIEFKGTKRVYGKDAWGNLVKGRVIGLHLLNRCDIDQHQFDYQLVGLKTIFSVPYKLVKIQVAAQRTRIRLKSPYREQLAQVFAMQFMRIGLVEDLPKEFPFTDK